jgi:cell wall-associated NlpC family hydrolase
MIKGKRTLLLAIVLAVAVALSALAAPHAGALTLAQKKAAAQAKVDKVRKELNALDVSLEKAVQRYDLANEQLAEVQTKVEAATRQLKVAQYQLRVAQNTLNNRVVAMYKQRPIDLLDVVFEAHSFDDMVTQLRTINELSANDSRIVTNVSRYEATVQQKHDVLARARVEARRLVTQVTNEKAGIEGQIAARQHVLDGAKAEVKKIQHQEAVAEARAAAAAAAAMGTVWRNPRGIPAGPAGNGHPEVIAIARKYLGIPYVYGAADPSVGFDCSGLVMYCYAQIGIQLPHYSGYQQNMGVPVPMNALRPGDLVFMGYPVSYHVALYAGGGQVIEAPHTGDVVKYWPVSSFQYAVRLQ